MLKHTGREMTMRIALILFVILFGSQMANAQTFYVMIDIKMMGKNATVPSDVRQWNLGIGQVYHTKEKCEYDLMYQILKSDYVLERGRSNKLTVNNYWDGKDLMQQWRCLKVNASVYK